MIGVELMQMNQSAKQVTGITEDEIIKEYRRNSEFRKCLETGNFIYVDGMLVVNAPQFVEHRDGTLVLTDFAHSNLAECALFFSSVRLPTLAKRATTFCNTPKISVNKEFDPSASVAAKQRYETVLETQSKLLQNFIKNISLSLNCWEMIGQFINIYKIEKFGKDGFCEKTRLGEHHYLCAKGEKKVKGQPSKITVISFAAGYDLPYQMAIRFLEAAGHTFSLASYDDNWYSFILCTMAGTSMDAKNEVLLSKGVKPLGSEQKK